MNADPKAATPGRTEPVLTDEDISRALDRLAKARVRLRDVTARVPVATRTRIEAVERAHRAVAQAAAVRERKPDDPAADKTHALAEVAEIMALRREGFGNWDDYQVQVAPTVSDPRVRDDLRRADLELAAAQAHWDVIKVGLLDGSEPPASNGPVLDLTGETPVIHPR